MSAQQGIGPKWNELFIPDTVVVTEQMEQSPRSLKDIECEFLKKSTQNEKELPYSKISNFNSPDQNNEESELMNSPNRRKHKIFLTRKWKFLLYIFNVFIILRKIAWHVREKRNLFQFHYSIFQEDDEFYLQQEPQIEKHIKTKIKEAFVKIVKAIFRRIPIVSPNNKAKFIWDFVMMLSTLIHFFLIIYNLSFEGTHEFVSFFHSWTLILIVIAPLDIFLKLNSGFFKNGFKIKVRSQILANYKKKELIYDVTCFLILIYTLVIESYFPKKHFLHFFQLIYIIKYPVFENILVNFEEIINVDEKFEALLSLSKLFIKLFFFSHLVACVWFYLGNNVANTETWLSVKGFEEKSNSFKYTVSLYWAITTISTTGYGDITPQNEGEFLFSLFIMILGSMFFGYLLTYIGVVFDKLQKDHVLKKEKVYALNKFMKKNSIEFETQMKIRKYMNFIWENEEKQITQVENDLFSKFSENLKRTFLSQTIGKFIFSLDVLSKNFSKEFLNQVMFLMKPKTFDPNSVIYKKGETDNCALYIIDKGEIASIFHTKSKDIVIRNYEKGDFFGEYEFFTNSERIYTVKSLTNSTIYMISLNDFLSVLANYPDDLEKYHFIKDKLLFSGESTILNKKCSSCLETNHILKNCPKLQTFASKSFVINKSRVSLNQERVEFKRLRMKQNSRKSLKYSQSKQANFIENLDQTHDATKIESLGKLMIASTYSNEYSLEEDEKNKSESPFLLNSPSFKNKGHPGVIVENIAHNNKLNLEEEKKFTKRKSKKEGTYENLKDIEEVESIQELDSSNDMEPKNESKINLEVSQISKFTLKEKNNPKIHKGSENEDSQKLYTIENFDSMKLFKNYYPNFNYNTILLAHKREYYHNLKKRLFIKKKQKTKVVASQKTIQLNNKEKNSIFSNTSNNSLKKKRFSIMSSFLKN